MAAGFFIAPTGASGQAAQTTTYRVNSLKFSSPAASPTHDVKATLNARDRCAVNVVINTVPTYTISKGQFMIPVTIGTALFTALLDSGSELHAIHPDDARVAGISTEPHTSTIEVEARTGDVSTVSGRWSSEVSMILDDSSATFFTTDIFVSPDLADPGRPVLGANALYAAILLGSGYPWQDYQVMRATATSSSQEARRFAANSLQLHSPHPQRSTPLTGTQPGPAARKRRNDDEVSADISAKSILGSLVEEGDRHAVRAAANTFEAYKALKAKYDVTTNQKIIAAAQEFNAVKQDEDEQVENFSQI